MEFLEKLARGIGTDSVSCRQSMLSNSVDVQRTEWKKGVQLSRSAQPGSLVASTCAYSMEIMAGGTVKH